MLDITPVASGFLPAPARDAMVAAFSARWRAAGVPARPAVRAGPPDRTGSPRTVPTEERSPDVSA